VGAREEGAGRVEGGLGGYKSGAVVIGAVAVAIVLWRTLLLSF